jgi:hypothetical protein
MIPVFALQQDKLLFPTRMSKGAGKDWWSALIAGALFPQLGAALAVRFPARDVKEAQEVIAQIHELAARSCKRFRRR